MKLLFDKNGNGSEELKGFIGWLYKANKFSNIQMDLLLAQEELSGLIGSAMINRALNYYHGENFEEDSLDAQLVEHIQLPVALLAYKSYSENTDVSHEDSGRKVKIDNENEKLPWEWMLDRDNAAILRKAYKNVDRLISFLEENIEEIEEWKNSEIRKEMNSLFISRTKEFDQIYSIEGSFSFFLRMLPFMKEIERKEIKPVLGDQYQELKEKKITGNLSGEEKELLEYVQNPIPFLSMSKAVKRLSLQIIPESITRNVSLKKDLSSIDFVNQIAAELEASGREELSALSNYLDSLNSPGQDEGVNVAMPQNSSSNKFFTS